MLFAESMETLTARFREVTVTLASDAEVPKKFPKDWLAVEAGEAAVRFVHANAGEGLETEVRGVLPQALAIELEPMSLRKIFLALVKSKAKRERRRA